MENVYSVKVRLDKEETQDMKQMLGREWHTISNYLYEKSIELSKYCGFEVNLYPSVVGDIAHFVITIESKSLSALAFADEFIRNKVMNKWEE